MIECLHYRLYDQGAYQMTYEQERDVLKKCIDLATSATGKKPRGYRAPLCQLRETTMALLEDMAFSMVIVPPLPNPQYYNAYQMLR